ncbi:aminotransferase class V-fold PLP-dependent enzyme [Hyphobacterium sp. HN65]|uniref:Aminotransferase class V-fold PLP-dependent enzyme n=1 Tax=Hyphobacterium lacteum TaxID=3116575 RepID=A0ABU7LQT4_9PROT|nr:aminotransferase class V-fold PLP-dependent enzyme [Hyphobacterium sp. HN65]MEE2525954.1 aminotransferase class V-fold PLP-dependent enzyme [Hyphobacterium sp. HN65]
MTQTDFRILFDFPDGITYLNCAYMGPMPRRAADAGKSAYDQRQRPWEPGVQDYFFDQPEALRAQAAKLFSASVGDVALVPAASYGLATAAANLKLEAGQEILTLAEQFPSNVYVWREKAEAECGQVRTVTRSANQSWTEAVMEGLGPQTAIVAIPEVHWADGGRLDLPAIRAELDKTGGRLVLDLTQSLGTSPFALDEIRPDFAVAAGYKWLLGPYTMGYLYIAPEHQSGRPLEEGWIVREGAEDFARLVDYADGYAGGARRFDMGERSGFQLVPAATESLRWLNGLGMDELAGQLAERTSAIEESVRSIGAFCNTPDRAGHYLCLALPDHAPKDLAARLADYGVSVSQRGDRLRVTPHLYNNESDIDRFARAMKAELG